MKSTSLKAATRQKTQLILHSVSDRRATPRFQVQFRSFVCDKSAMNEQLGSVLDLSLAGCRVEAPIAVQPSLQMELRIYVPDLDWPIMVDRAVVQWVNGTTFGLHFVKLRPGQEERLAWVIARVAEDSEQYN